MGFIWKTKPKKRYKKYGPFTVRRREIFMGPDEIEQVTMWWFGKTLTIWKRAK